MPHPKLGFVGKDVITGFEGRITARIEYLTGCDQLCIQPPINEKREVPEPKWFDEKRVEIQPDEQLTLASNEDDGFDINIPLPL